MSKNILVIEDDPCLQDVYSIILESAGHKVTVSANADLIFKENPPLPDVFLLDKQIQGMDGLDVCRYLKTHPKTKNIPVIIISASINIHALAKSAGADASIAKPFDNKNFLEIIEEQLYHAEA